ncbi:TraB/GumN family protein [Marilutibacter spongiae]|uniref:TraB/GumN family protein n=1 Tax=Marilutibacter spongiae TaxID=2025720 RepID=A0A7W3Y666_9GAMM|nr:TraB/GumN family protein [Lysobacter spongiae]MBB1061168.1 TraB/GumN family protein [Lysobacter spongiae]
MLLRKAWFACCLAAMVFPGVTNPRARSEDALAAPSSSAAAPPLLDAVTVTPSQSPPLWLFTRGARRIIVLGTQAPLPRDAVLVSDTIQRYIAESDIALTAPGILAGDSGGIMQGITLWSAIRKARRNPDGRTLDQVLPSQSYAHWQSLKQKYIGNDSGVEKLRPMYAAFELYRAAMAQHGLSDEPVVGKLLADALEATGRKRVDARYAIPVGNRRLAAKAFEVNPARDVECLEQTLEHLEAYLEFSPGAADAWAAGDLERYRNAEALYTPIHQCWAELTNEAIATATGVPAPYQMRDTAWLKALDDALSRYDTVFTTLPARDILMHQGMAARLEALGYAIKELSNADPVPPGLVDYRP